MQKKQIAIGERFGLLTVIGYEESDSHGNQYVLVRCRCNDETVKRMRATALTMLPYQDKNGKMRLPNRSCGCASKDAYRDYWINRAHGIRKLVCKNVWTEYQKNPHLKVVADKFHLPAPLIVALVRRYNTKRRATRFGATIKGSKARDEWYAKEAAESDF